MTELHQRECQPCRKGTPPLGVTEASGLLQQLDQGWRLDEENSTLQRTLNFDNYYQTIAFVNALAWIVHREDHHPDLVVGYNRCTVRFTTHSIGGLSQNDFICAAKLDLLAA